MKKVLFATTALVATAGVASADIALTGVAQMGVQGGSGGAVTQFVQDIDITFTMSGETDNGLTFGAAIDLDENAANVGVDDAGVAIFVGGDFGTVTMGDTDGAFDWALQEVNINEAASINDDHTEHAGFFGNQGMDGFYDGQILRYDYTIAGFGIALSVEQDDQNVAYPGGFGIAGPSGATGADPIYAIGLRYSGEFGGGSYGVGIGYQASGDIQDQTVGSQDVSIVGISGSVELDAGFSAALNYSQIDTFVVNGDGVHMAIGASYTFDAITVHANYGQFDWDAGANVADSNGFGLSAAYDLTGGLSAHVGYGYSDVTAANASATPLGDSSTWSFGLNMAF